ncbi:hypothetical protein [Spectribacter hydrogenoxidans]|uniref:Phage tail tape measure protein, lambda family n=1 Tax=Spectribacter hydrogenoxidans TaxID=3075608 RepID=A0ABU3C0K8_9GAMM|nr:hypothetical protein [Salinisphaera sp. W335]MDT0635103.1 hypothetical protein [Salinisphaera sp. W335]
MPGRADNLDLALRIRADLQRAREELRSAERDLIEFGTAGDKAETGLRGMNQQVDRSERGLKRFSDSGDRVRRVLGALAGAAAFGALARGAGQVVQNLEEVQRTALSLGESVEEVQELNFVFRQFGLDTNDVSDALNTLADRALDAQGGMASFIDDFALIGITVDDLRGKDPVQLFELFVDRISQIEDVTRRNAAAVRIFGDDLGRRLLPFLVDGADGFDKLRQEARDANAVLSEAAVDGAAAASREFRKLREIFSAQFTQAVAGNADEFQDLAEILSSDDVIQGLEVIIGGLARMSGWLLQVTSLLSEAGQGIGEAFARADVGADNAADRVDDRIAEVQRRLEGDFSGSGLAAGRFGPGAVRQGDAAGAEREALEDELRRLLELRQRLASEASAAAQARIDAEGDAPEEPESPRTPSIPSLPPVGGGDDGDDAAAEAAEEAAEARRESEEALRDRIQAMEKSRRSNQGMVESLEEEIELSQLGNRERAQEIAVRRLNRDATDEQREAVRELAGRLFDLKEQSEDTAEGMSEFFAEAAREIQSSLADFLIRPFEEGLDGLLASFADTLQRMAAEAAAAQITDAVFGSEFGQTGDIGGLLSQGAGFLGGLFGGGGGGFNFSGVGAQASGVSSLLPTSTAFAGIPGLANGGTARAGLPHIVGERGPELFIPQMTGQVVPNGQFSAGEPITVENIIRTRDPDTTVESRAVRGRRAHQSLQRGRRSL